MDITNYIPINISRGYESISDHFSRNKKSKFILLLLLFFITVYSASKYTEERKVIYRDSKKLDFTQGRIFGSQKNTYLKSKEKQLNKAAKKIMASNKTLLEKVDALEKRLEAKK